MPVHIISRLSILAVCVMGGHAASAQALSAGCGEALSQQRVTIVVPNRAGGGYDTYARAFAPALAATIGSDVDVVNMPGGGGRLALSQVSGQGPDETLLLIDNFGDVVAGTDGDAELGIASSAFEALGIVVSEPVVWLGRSGIDLSDPALAGLVASAASVQANVVDVGLAGAALGLGMQVVAGYDGSSEAVAAILRGESDLTSLTLTTALRNAAGTDLGVILLLSDEPDDRALDAMPLGGENGLAARRAADLSESERAARMTVAEQVVSLTNVQRGFLTAATLGADRLACLREATDIALGAPVFLDAAEAQGRPVAARPSAEAAEAFAALQAAFGDVADKLEPMAEALSR